MRMLVLIRHSLPEIDPLVAAREWHLSDEGRRRCLPLAKTVSLHDPTLVVTSTEFKAVETGQIIAAQLGVRCGTAEDLHEHERPLAPWQGSDSFERQVARFFDQPGNLVLGDETADQARTRFGAALQAVLSRYPEGNLAVVSHGTVISTLVAYHNGLDPFRFWKSLGLPAVVLLDVPSFRLWETVEDLPV